MDEQQPNFLARLMKSASKIEPNELRSVLLSFLFAFCLMFAWYLLRPVRDAMAVEWTDAEVSFLWNINFFVSAAVVALYGLAVSRLEFLRHLLGRFPQGRPLQVVGQEAQRFRHRHACPAHRRQGPVEQDQIFANARPWMNSSTTLYRGHDRPPLGLRFWIRPSPGPRRAGCGALSPRRQR
jgi:hypothetical protein